MATDPTRFIIVGAGVSGLTLARALSAAGQTIRVLEADDQVGGLARSFKQGEFTFDVGPHRFHTEDTEVNEVLAEVLGENRLEIDRSSAVWMFGRYFRWPLSPGALLRLPPATAGAAIRDLFRRSRFEQRRHGGCKKIV